MKRRRGTKCFLIVFIVFCFPTNCLLAKQSGQADAFQRGLTALQDNRYTDALEEFTAAEREHPDDARIHKFRGIALARLGENAKAAAEYQESIRADPRMEDAYRNLGFLEWTEHQLEPARHALERAVELSPSDSFAHYYLGRVELDGQRYSQAIQELETSRVALPTDADFSIQLANAYVALERRDDAQKALDRLLTLSLSDAQSIQAVSLLLVVHQTDAAMNLIQRLNARPSAAETRWLKFDLALVYLLTGNHEKALVEARVYRDSLPQVASKWTASAEGWSLIGIACAHLGQGERSINAFRQAAILAPGEEEHWLNLTRELMELNRYPEAISAAQSGLAANPKSYALHLRLGAAQLSAGHYAEAESVFRDLVVAGDPLPTGYVGLAQVLLRTGRAEEAASELADAQQKLGPNFLLSYFRGLSLDRAGKPSEALIAFQEAVRLNENNAEVHLSLGKTDLALGRVSDAIAELQNSLRLSPSNVQAKRLLSQAYRRAGDTKSAEKFATASADAPPVGSEGDLLGDFFVPHWQAPPSTPGAVP
ncbi:MAG: tetratricopeptide repeat protein [Terriglobales bacterium]